MEQSGHRKALEDWRSEWWPKSDRSHAISEHTETTLKQCGESRLESSKVKAIAGCVRGIMQAEQLVERQAKCGMSLARKFAGSRAEHASRRRRGSHANRIGAIRAIQLAGGQKLGQICSSFIEKQAANVIVALYLQKIVSFYLFSLSL